MNVKYFIDIIDKLLKKGASQAEIAKTLGFSKQNMSEILGKVKAKPRQDLKSKHLPGLLKLCKGYKVGPQTYDALMDLIEKEVDKGEE